MLSEIRKNRGLTQKELGIKIGRNKSYISRLENKIIINVSVEILAKLSEALDADETEIFLFFFNAYIEKIKQMEKEEETIENN